MTASTTMPFAAKLAAGTTRFLSGGRFPAFGIFALFFYQIFVAIMAYAPEATGVWGDFIEDFRARCFQVNPKTGWLEMNSVWLMVTEPIPLQVIFLVLWWNPLREMWRAQRRAFLSTGGAALALVGLIAGSLLGIGRSQAVGINLPFPAERIRTALPFPAFNLRDQDDQEISPATLKGRVVLMTAIYSTCTTACPMMLNRIRGALDGLTSEERDQMTVLAFSLNPESDTREMRAAIAKMYGLKARFHFVNGKSQDMNALLDNLNIARVKDEKTGEIIHSTLFMLTDKQGRIAYSLSSSDQEQSWLSSAIRLLLSEKDS